jgi:hypothetical protein
VTCGTAALCLTREIGAHRGVEAIRGEAIGDAHAPEIVLAVGRTA